MLDRACAALHMASSRSIAPQDLRVPGGRRAPRLLRERFDDMRALDNGLFLAGVG